MIDDINAIMVANNRLQSVFKMFDRLKNRFFHCILLGNDVALKMKMKI